MNKPTVALIVLLTALIFGGGGYYLFLQSQDEVERLNTIVEDLIQERDGQAYEGDDDLVQF